MQMSDLPLTTPESDAPYMLQENDLRGCIPMAAAVEAVKRGFMDWEQNAELNGFRQRMHAQSGVRVSVHPGMSPGAGAGGLLVHCESVRPSHEEQTYLGVGPPVVVLYSTEDAHLLGILIGSISCAELPECRSAVAVRTAATSALGTFAMARPDSRRVGILGTGDQARNHLVALNAVRKLERVVAFSRNEENRRRFSEEMGDVLEIEVEAVGSAREAVESADIIVAATNSNTPVLDGSWLSPGQHVTSIVGSNVGLLKAGAVSEKRRELDDESVRRARLIGLVSRDQAIRDEQADIYGQAERGVTSWDNVTELTDLLTGKTGRTDPSDITIFKNNAGMGIADVALAAEVLARHRNRA